MSIRRNTIYNLFGSLLPLAVSLLTIPVYIQLIGEERYGVLAIVWLLLGYFGLFDLGLGRATAQHIAKLRDQSAQHRARVFWTALSMNLGLGILGGLISWPIAAYFFAHVFKTDPSLYQEIQHAVPWLVLAVPLAIFTGTLSGALQGRERFFELNLISVAGTVLFQLLPLAAAKYLSVNLNILLAVVIFARLLSMLALFQRCKKHIILNYRPEFDRLLARQLLHFGGWVTVTSLVSPMMVILDRFIIGALLGAKAVTYYTVPFQLADRTRIIPGALSSALFPRLSAAVNEEEKRLANEALSVLIVIMTPIIVSSILLIKPFLLWWIGAEFARQSTLLGQIVLLGFWINGLSTVPYAQLQARGKPGLVAKCHLFEVLPYFLLLYLGLNHLGLVGAAGAFSIRVLLDFVLLSGLAGNLTQALRLVLTPVLLLLIGLWITLQSSVGSSEWLIYVAAHMLITISWAWLKAPDSIKNSLFTKLKRVF